MEYEEEKEMEEEEEKEEEEKEGRTRSLCHHSGSLVRPAYFWMSSAPGCL